MNMDRKETELKDDDRGSLHWLGMLENAIKEHESLGSEKRNLGLQKMPDGYALMVNGDYTHYYWLRWDGEESMVHWDKWAVYRGARADTKKHTAESCDGAERRS